MTPPEAQPVRLLNDIPLRVLLVGGFLVAGLIPLMILSLASYRTAHEELKQQAFHQLEAVRDIKRQQVQNYFQERLADLRVFAETPSLRQAYEECLAARRRRDPRLQQALNERLDPYLRTLLRQYGYNGLYLVDGAAGTVLLKAEGSRPTASGGGRASGPWQEALRRGDAVLSDIERGTSGGAVVQYVAAPLATGPEEAGVIVARLALDPIRRMMAERTGMGLTGETYLVGADRRLRSDSHLDPRNRSLPASLAGTVGVNGVDTESVSRSLQGETGTASIHDYRGIPVLSAFAPLRIEGITWVIVAEIDVAEIDQQIRGALNPAVLAITFGAALLLLVLALVITHFIGRDIQRVGDQLKAMIDGVLHDRMDGQIDPRQVGVDFRGVAAQSGHLVAAFRDHVERIRRLEEHQRFTQKIEAIGTLAGGIAHDFNNILTYMLAYSRLAMKDLPRESPVGEYLQGIVSGIHRAGELIRRIQSFSRPSLPGPACEDARDVCRETIAILRATLPKKIEVRSDLGRWPLPVCCSAGSFQQIIMNLCTNAYHAMQEKGGVLTLSLSRMEPGAGETAATPWVRLSVRDTGCGMDAGVRSRLFEPLFTTKPAGIGSGLGLTMVRETVRACHGRIQVNSGPGQGSEFIIELPQPPVADTAPARGISGAVKAQDPARILFVDDEERIRISEKQLLEELGFQTDTAADAEEALRLHAEVPSRYRLVITDLNMPGGNGVELAESLHRLEPDLPIILTTGYSDMLQEIDAGRTGIRAVLSKPFDMEELYEALHELAFV